MFGAFRCNEDARDNLEYIDLSGNSSVDARNYTVLACDQCRTRKVKCSGDLHGCQRCQATFTTCTYRSPAKFKYPSNSKHRQTRSDFNLSSMPPAKRQQTKSNTNYRPATVVVSGIPTDMSQSLSSVGPTSLTPSGHVLAGYLQDLDDDFHTKQPQALNLKLSEGVDALHLMSPLPELQTPSSNSASIAGSNASDNLLNSLIMTPQTTASPTATSPSLDSSEYRSRRCECIQSLADTLEKINGDDGSDIYQTKGFDDLLLYLRDGIETCKRVLPCKICYVCTTNSILVVTIVRQLATLSQDLCRQLLTYHQKVKTTSPVDAPPPLLLNGEIYIGKYQVRAEAVCLEFIFALVSIHLKDLQRLLGHLRNEIREGTKAFKLLMDAADSAKEASSDLQIITVG